MTAARTRTKTPDPVPARAGAHDVAAWIQVAESDQAAVRLGDERRDVVARQPGGDLFRRRVGREAEGLRVVVDEACDGSGVVRHGGPEHDTIHRTDFS